MLDPASIGTMVLGASGLITGLLALFSAKTNRSKTDSETDINIATVEHSREQLHQSRETFLREEIEKMREVFDHEIAALKEEVSALRSLIEAHVPWDWEVVRQLKLAGIDFRPPPTLNYMTRKKEES